MKKSLCIMGIILWFCNLSGCITAPKAAPCDWSGTHCWPRTPINQWDPHSADN